MVIMITAVVAIVLRERVVGGRGGRVLEYIGAKTILEVLEDRGEEGHQRWRRVVIVEGW